MPHVKHTYLRLRATKSSNGERFVVPRFCMRGLLTRYSINHMARPLLTNVRTKTALIVDKVLRMRRPLLQMIQMKTPLVADKVNVLRTQGRWNQYVSFW